MRFLLYKFNHQLILVAQATLLARLKHPNIVAYRESFYSPDGMVLHIAMAFCEGGDMFTK